MAREWKVKTDTGLTEADLAATVARLQAETGLSAVTLKVCVTRGLATAEAIQDFLSPRLESLKDPHSLKDMDRAIDRLAQARALKEKIRVYGDYDVDDTTGAALLTWIFRDCGLDFEARQPDRFKDGYGLNVGAVEDSAAAGAKVLITVDCGITSFDAAEKARELGVDLIVVDHHQLDPVKGLPPAHAVVNPQRPDCESGLKQLCGCGLAFYLARALRTRGRADAWWPQGSEPNLKQHLDLVVMATAADMVPLLGDNHALVRHGMEILKHTKKPGVRALLDVAGVSSANLSPGHLGFVLGPRINASGRMSSASLALELLTTTDSLRAAKLAQELETLNKERAELQNRIWDQVRERVEKGIAEGKYVHGIAVADAAWHEGVVGIVASRVTETFHRPAAVIALREDGIGKGSVRSFAGKDVLAALRATSTHLLGFGGHKHAAGLSVSASNAEAFATAFDEALGALAEDVGARPLMLEGECEIEDLDVRTLQELERLGPFGPGNPEPVFRFRAAAKNQRILKGRHLKFNLAPLGVPLGSPSALIDAIWFHAAERPEIQSGENTLEGEWAAVPELNRFQGRVTPTLRVKDWRREIVN